MLATFHNHTTWSDGKATPAEMHAAAIACGVELLGISDHFCLMPDGTTAPNTLTLENIPAYLSALRALKDDSRIETIIGLEFDWFNNHNDVLAPFAEDLPLDYRIGAVHFVDGVGFDIDATFWATKDADERDAVFAGYWQLMREMAESRLFDIAAHLDLPKKFGFAPQRDMRALQDAALDAIRASNMVVELNTAGYRYQCAEGYPTLDLLRRCRQREIPVTLSADAHHPAQLVSDFARGAAALYEAGYTTAARFRNREMWAEPLSAAAPQSNRHRF